jgi:hypothetical protein
MNEELNIPLRSEVLGMALTLEDAINQLLILYLNIESEELRTLGNKSSSISFKNKIDLLTDINVFSKNENLQFETFMQFRNQFLHNLSCSTFEIALKHLGNGTKKQLLNYSNSENAFDMEFLYIDAFRALNVACLDSILNKITERSNKQQNKITIIKSIIDHNQYVINKDSALFSEIIELCFPIQGDTKEVIKFKEKVADFISAQTKILTDDDEYHKLSSQLEAILEPNFFKIVLE